MNILHSMSVQQHYEVPLLANGKTWAVIFIVFLILTPILIELFATDEYIDEENIQENQNTKEKIKSNYEVFPHREYPKRNKNNTLKEKNIDESQETTPVWTTGIFYNQNFNNKKR